MKPAFSILFFTTLSGSGLGLLVWLSLGLLLAPAAVPPGAGIALLGFGLALVAVGLTCSLAHLGQPQRAWRALSQWRSSWLSREGVLAVVLFPCGLLLALGLWQGDALLTGFAAAATIVVSIAVLLCTAMIYASLRTIPAWSHPLVAPGFLGLGLFGGAAWAWVGLALAGTAPTAALGLGTLLLALAVLVLKLAYWRQLPRLGLPSDRHGALGLRGLIGAGRAVADVEAPHTEENFITREMVFTFARRHATPLRTGAIVLVFAAPLGIGAVSLAVLPPGWLPLGLLVAAGTLQAGLVVERWLFFAEARHVVGLYYPRQD